MRPISLKLFGITSLFTTLFFSVPQASAISPTQHSPLPSLIVANADSLPVINPQVTVSAPQEQRNAKVLYALVQELHSLPVGKKYGYYRQALEQQGYYVLGNYNDHQHWEFALEKNQQHLRLIITYNPETKMSTLITASGPRVAD